MVFIRVCAKISHNPIYMSDSVYKFRAARPFLWLFLLIILVSSRAAATPSFDLGPLPVDSAFQLSLSVNSDKTLRTTWIMQKGYYLYRDRFHFTLLDAKPININPENWPPSKQHYSDILGHYTTYQDNLVLTLPLSMAATQSTVQIQYQGCSEANFCYPPQTQSFNINFATGEVQKTIAPIIETNNDMSVRAGPALGPAQEPVPTRAEYILFTYLGLGLLLAFTPCVLPLLPILSGLILGHSTTLKTKRALLLSIAYVLGMCITYTLAGLLFSLLGLSLQSTLQTPWMIGFLSLLFVVLAVCLFTGRDLRLPQKWTHKMTQLSEHQPRGHFFGVALIGALSALIVSPCVSAPLVGALAYISQTHNLWLGGAALFCLSLGMGLPLIVFNTFGAHYIPKTGPWMLAVKKCFAFIFLGMAIWLASRLLPSFFVLFLWGILLLLVAYSSDLLNRAQNKKFSFRLRQTLGAVCAVYGILLIVGTSLGHSNIWLPLKATSVESKLNFTTVTTMDALDAAIQNADGKPVLIDFYADWCLSCKELDRDFYKPEMTPLLQQFHLVRVDMTRPSADINTILKRWNVIAPPTLIMLNAQGKMLISPIVGAVNSTLLQQKLQMALAGQR
jgi:thiol:disulfide interchange protein DsbD